MLSRYTMVFVTATLLIAGACGSAEAQTGEELVPLYEAYVAAFNALDLEGFLTFWADGSILDYVPIPPLMTSEEEIRRFYTTLLVGPGEPGDILINDQRILTSGNILVTENLVTGTHLVEWAGIPPTGNSFMLPHLSILEYEGGKIEKQTTYMDNVTLFMQLGAMPAGELPPLTPSFTLPDPEPTGLAPLKAAEELLARFNAHDLAGFARMVHPATESFIAPMGIPLDRSSLIAALELYILGFSDIQGEIVRSVDLGDGWVFLEQVYQGTNDGPFFGSATGKRAAGVRCGFLERYDSDGLLTEFRDYYDNLGLMMQLGLVPPPAPSAVSPVSWGEIKSKFR